MKDFLGDLIAVVSLFAIGYMFIVIGYGVLA
jgi:hypothetical protein